MGALHLVQAWVEKKMKGPNQVEGNIFSGTAEICEEKYEMYRTQDSISCFWGRLAGETQIYLSAVSALN